jgi:hypothetical protein
MQYPPRRTLALTAGMVVVLMGCAVEEPEPGCDLDDPGFGLDVQLGGLDDRATYQFEVLADGGLVALSREPGMASSFAEAALSGDRTLLVALFDDVLRIAVFEPDGDASGPETSIVRVHAGGALLVEETFTPSYTSVAPVSAECGAFMVELESLVVPPAR